jgi:hypothetical protein
MPSRMKLKNILAIIVSICLLQVVSGQNSEKKSDKPITITGKVLSLNQEPVEGALFYIDNIKTNFKSKSNGTYKIKVSSAALKLEVRSTDYGFCETLINQQTKINFILNGHLSGQRQKR